MSSLKKITVSTRDNQIFELDPRFSTLCKTLGKVLEDNSISEEIPIDVDSKILLLIIKYAEHYNYSSRAPIKKPLGPEPFSMIVGPFDDEFMNSMDDETLFTFSLATSYLAYDDLFDLFCAFLANRYKGKKFRKEENI